ncbi:sensor histidine kinase [Solidesulfovibrio sp.]
MYQIKLEQGYGLTDRLNFRPVSLDNGTVELETLYHPFDVKYFQNETKLAITIYLLPDAANPPAFINCTAPLLEVISNTRLRIAVPEHVDRLSHNKTDRIQLEPRHVPILAAWCLIKKCDNIRLLKMFNPLILHMPKGSDPDRGLINISSKGACISLGRESYQQHKKDIKNGRDLLLQMSFPGPESTQRYEYLVIAVIRYLRPNLVSGRMEIGLQFNHCFAATPRPHWMDCEKTGIPELKWLLQEYKRIYLAEIKKKLTALCDPDSLEDAAGDAGTAPADSALTAMASMNKVAQGLFNDCLPRLSNIKLGLQFLRGRDENDPKGSLLNTSIQQLEVVTTKLENVQEMTGGDKAVFVAVRLRDILTQAIEAFDSIIESNGITVERHFQDNIPDIQGDPRQLRLVFKNLILNAVESMHPQGGGLRLSITQDTYQNDLVISVEDMGGGIPGDVRARIFQPYQSIKEYAGLGLGLAVSQRIAGAHGGRIELLSSLGEGSTFTVRLPIDACLTDPDKSECTP